jgi:hypothetical protein
VYSDFSSIGVSVNLTNCNGKYYAVSVNLTNCNGKYYTVSVNLTNCNDKYYTDLSLFCT